MSMTTFAVLTGSNISMTIAPGQKVLKKVHDPAKLGVRTTGPYNIEHTHVNGTLTIELRPGITEHINIRNVIPYLT